MLGKQKRGTEGPPTNQALLTQQFPMGPGSDGPMGGMGGMEPHHMNGSLGKLAPTRTPPTQAADSALAPLSPGPGTLFALTRHLERCLAKENLLPMQDVGVGGVSSLNK